MHAMGFSLQIYTTRNKPSLVSSSTKRNICNCKQFHCSGGNGGENWTVLQRETNRIAPSKAEFEIRSDEQTKLKPNRNKRSRNGRINPNRIGWKKMEGKRLFREQIKILKGIFSKHFSLWKLINKIFDDLPTGTLLLNALFPCLRSSAIKTINNYY